MRTFLAAGAILAGFSFGVMQAVPGHAATGHNQDPPIRTEWLPCGTEDSPQSCVWDALHRGNGQGQSFYIGREGKVWPLPHHIAHYLIHGDSHRSPYVACETPVGADPTSCIWEETVWLGRYGDDTVIPHSVARYLLNR